MRGRLFAPPPWEVVEEMDGRLSGLVGFGRDGGEDILIDLLDDSGIEGLSVAVSVNNKSSSMAVIMVC